MRGNYKNISHYDRLPKIFDSFDCAVSGQKHIRRSLTSDSRCTTVTSRKTVCEWRSDLFACFFFFFWIGLHDRTVNHDGNEQTRFAALRGHPENHETTGGFVRRKHGHIHLRESQGTCEKRRRASKVKTWSVLNSAGWPMNTKCYPRKGGYNFHGR